MQHLILSPCFCIRQGSRMRLGVTAKVGRIWKWSNGVKISEMGIFWCISISWGQTGRKLRTRQHGLLTQLSVKPQQWLPVVMRMISTPLFIPSVLSSPKCLAARVWPFHSNSLLEILSVSLWILWGRGHIQLLSQQRKRRKVSQQKDATRRGDWNSLAGRKPSLLQMLFFLC